MQRVYYWAGHHFGLELLLGALEELCKLCVRIVTVVWHRRKHDWVRPISGAKVTTWASSGIPCAKKHYCKRQEILMQLRQGHGRALLTRAKWEPREFEEGIRDIDIRHICMPLTVLSRLYHNYCSVYLSPVLDTKHFKNTNVKNWHPGPPEVMHWEEDNTSLIFLLKAMFWIWSWRMIWQIQIKGQTTKFIIWTLKKVCHEKQRKT
jgi:hypothetical protein